MTEKLKQKKLLEQLEKIGLHGTDAEVYLASIHLGACTIKQLTAHTDINRVTVHDSVKRLIKKGILMETFSNKRRLVFPQQISNLQHLVDLKKSETDQLQHDVSTTIHLLQSLHLESAYLPHIRISKGRTGIAQMLAEIKERSTEDVKIISDSWHFDELLNINFLDNLQYKKHSVNIILPPGFEHFVFSAHAKGIDVSSHTILPDMQWSGGMTLWGEFVALHAYEGVYITTTIIENKAISQMMKNSFETM